MLVSKLVDYICLVLPHTTGGGQKLRTGSLVLPVADSIFKRMYFASVLLATGS